MATYRKRGKKWQAQVRREGRAAVSRSFIRKSDGEWWARQVETATERGDLPDSSRSSLKTITLHQPLERYEDTVTPLKKSKSDEKYRLRSIKKHPIANVTLDKLNPTAVTIYRDDRLQLVSPSSVRRELALLQHCVQVARVEWGIALQRNSVDQEAVGERTEATQDHG